MHVGPSDEQIAESRGDEDSIDQDVQGLRRPTNTQTKLFQLFEALVLSHQVLLACRGRKKTSG